MSTNPTNDLNDVIVSAVNARIETAVLEALSGDEFFGRMVTATLPSSVASFDLPDGDCYIGEVVETFGNVVVLRNYSAWYEGDTAPYNSPYFEDEVCFSVAPRSVVTVFAGGAR